MTVVSINIKEIELNEKQSECVNTLLGPVLVLAGPGTGKTTVVIERIIKMLESDIKPESILALTFSEAAATEIKTRLVKKSGNKASSVVIHTYHAFCSDLIYQNPLKFELLEDFSVIDDLNKHSLMREVLDEYRPKTLLTRGGDYYYFIPTLIKCVHDIKLNRINKENYFSVIENNESWKPELKALKDDLKTQEELEKQGKRNRLKTVIKQIEKLENDINKAYEIWEIYEKYNKKLLLKSLIDFDDMINFVLEEFNNDPSFLEEVRNKFNHILVDEYQDTNYSQNELIFNLASDNSNANIFVVGDDDQIIYTFQGAMINNIENFLKRYPDSKVICLNENNRSTQTILDLSYNIICQDTSRLENNKDFSNYNISKKLTAKNKHLISNTNKVQLQIFADNVQEQNYIIDKIEMLIKDNSNSNLSEIAVLTRTNSELESFADLLKARNIPYQVNKQKEIFELKPSILIYYYLKALENHNTGSQGLFGITGHPPFSFATEDYTFLCSEASKTYKDFITLINENLNKHSWKDKTTIEKFINDFNFHKSQINNMTLRNLIIEIINNTDILKHYMTDELNRLENLSSIRKLVDTVKSFEHNNKPCTLSLLLESFDSSIRENIALEIEKNNFIENAIQLLTVHGAKGREFSYLFLPNLISKNWEKKRSSQNINLPIDKPELSKESEVARLLFVACSRAKHSLYLSYPNTINGKTTELCSFIQNISSNEQLVEFIQNDLNPESLTTEIYKHLATINLLNKKDFTDSLKQLASKHIMSPSSLHSYETCPKLFLFRYIYRIPTIGGIRQNMNYGSAVHKALEKFIKLAMKNNLYPDKNTLVKHFKSAMDQQAFYSIQDRDIYYNRGLKVLNNYYSNIISTPLNCIVSSEMNLDLISLEKYLIKGKIDLVQIDEKNNYRLLDYKTGNFDISKNKVLNEDGSHRHYYDQLRFYKLLFESRYPEKNVTQGILYFVEAQDKNLYIDLVNHDKDIIKARILETFNKINNLFFTGVDEEKQSAEPCQNCDYKMLCKLNTI
ncbi:MAG: ATP-dependent DNA helicase [Cyanobacteriota bacterium]